MRMSIFERTEKRVAVPGIYTCYRRHLYVCLFYYLPFRTFFICFPCCTAICHTASRTRPGTASWSCSRGSLGSASRARQETCSRVASGVAAGSLFVVVLSAIPRPIVPNTPSLAKPSCPRRTNHLLGDGIMRRKPRLWGPRRLYQNFMFS